MGHGPWVIGGRCGGLSCCSGWCGWVVGKEQQVVGNRRWEMGNGQWAIGGRRWAAAGDGSGGGSPLCLHNISAGVTIYQQASQQLKKGKETYLRAQGHCAPEPVIVVVGGFCCC